MLIKYPKTILDISAFSQDFLKMLVKQIKREFISFDWDVLDGDFEDGHLLKIKSYLKYDIEDFYSNNSNLFNHFLYRIDISNTQIEQYTMEHVFEDVYECIAEMVIIRCAQKVYYKQKYSS